jgi:hypothetical protein
MPRSFKLTVPKSVLPLPWAVGLGVLLAANLAAAAFAFHIFDASPQALDQELTAARSARQAAQARLARTRTLASSVDLGRNEGDKFFTTYVMGRRHTYSTILGEITQIQKTAGMEKAAMTIAPLDPIPGSDNLDMMSISLNLEGTYAQLMKFVNLLDRSPRFLIIETLTVTPRAKSDILVVTFKLDTFVKEDVDGVS